MTTTAKTFRLGKTLDRGRLFRIPDELLVETTGIIGRRGSGKTNTAVRLVEQALRQKHQVVAIDPLDVWWGLKARGDGKPSGLDVLLLGDPRKPHTDLPLTETDGTALANLLVDETLSAVLSMRHLSKSAVRRFLADFLEALYLRKGDPKKASACLIAADEVSIYCPQQIRTNDAAAARCVGAMEAIVRQGRASGLGAMLIDQRPASVAWVWSPAWLEGFERVSIDFRETFDSSKTPRPGDRAVKSAKVTKFDLEDIRGRWSEVIEQAEKADPRKLEKKLDQVQRENRRLRAEVEQLRDQPSIDETEAQRLADQAASERDDWWQGRMDELPDPRELIRVATEVTSTLQAEAEQLGVVFDSYKREAPPRRKPINGHRKPATPPVPPAPPAPTPRVAAAEPTPAAGSGQPVNGPKQAILDALAWFASVGIEAVDRSHVAAVAGVSVKSSGYEKNVSTLRTMGLISYPAAGSLALTGEGSAQANAPTAAVTLDALHAAWLSSKALSGPQRTILKALIEVAPDAVSREQLAGHVGVSAASSGFEKNVSRLSSLRLATYPQPGHVAAGPMLFPEDMK